MAGTSQNNNNIRSEDVSVRFFVAGNKELVLNHLNFSVKENASEGVDDICGEKRSNPYTVTNYFDIDFEGTQVDTTTFQSWLDNISSKDANTGEVAGLVSLQVTNKKGVSTSYVCIGVTRKAWSLTASGRSDPFKLASGFKARYFKPV